MSEAVQRSRISPRAEEAPLLSVRRLAIGRGRVVLAEDLDFELSAGELLAIVGPSGCGKSTLLLALCGLIDPHAGTVLLEGREAHAWGYPAFRRRLVYLPQKPSLLDTTVQANLQRVFSYHSAGGAGLDLDEAQRLLERLHLPASYLEKQAHELSVGEQQRLCLLRSLLVQPMLLLCDEPTSALDRANRDLVEELLAESARERGLAAIIVTHDQAQAERLCSRVIDLTGHAARPAPRAEAAR